MLQCPRCKSDRIHFSRTRSKWEGWRKEITGKRPYRCPDCLWRGWAPDPRAGFSAEGVGRATSVIGPHSTLRDSMLEREEGRPKDVNLDRIDEAFVGTRNTSATDGAGFDLRRR